MYHSYNQYVILYRSPSEIDSEEKKETSYTPRHMAHSFWWIKALVGIVGLTILQYVMIKFLSKDTSKQGKAERIKNICLRPLTVLMWALGILYLVNLCGSHLGFSIGQTFLEALRKTFIVCCITWLLFRWKKEIETRLLSDPTKKVDKAIVQAIGRLATIGIAILSALILLQIFGVNTAPLLAFGSIGAASIGFAGKDVMANFCSGIMLQISRPLVQGDQIYLPEKNLEGHIEEIGWFRTLIRDTEKRAVYLPNNFFSTSLVINISRMTHRHIHQILRVPFTSVGKLHEAISEIRDKVIHFPGIDTKYPLHVYLKTFGAFACEIELEAYSLITDAEPFKRSVQELLLHIQSVLADMDIPFAIQTVELKNSLTV
jgi:MscS family membrane protein